MRQRRSCAARGRVLVHSRPLTLRPRCASAHFPAPHRGPDRKLRAKDFWGICVSLEFYWASLQTSAHICISHIALHRIQSLHIRPDVHAWTEGSTLRISSTRSPQGRTESGVAPSRCCGRPGTQGCITWVFTPLSPETRIH